MDKFNDLKIVIPSPAEVQETSMGLIGAIAKSHTAKMQIEAVSAFNTYRSNLMGTLFTSHIRDNLDVNNEEYRVTYQKALQIYPMMQGISAQFYGVLLISPFKAELVEVFGDRVYEIAVSQMKTLKNEIVPLLQEEFVIANEYNKIIANASFIYHGETISFAKLQSYMESSDRETRKEAYQMWSDFFASNEDAIDDIYDRLVKNRDAQGKMMGFETYTQYIYAKLNRTDYDQADVAKFRDGILKYIVPINEELRVAQAKRIGVDALKCYDEPAKFASSNARPIGDSEYMVQTAREMFLEMSPKTGEYFGKVADREFYDLDARFGKKQGGFCMPVMGEKLPYIFCNFNGTSGDFKVLVHEAGHGYQTYSTMDKPIFDYTFGTLETGEVHSMSMEFLSWPWAEKFMGENTDKYKYTHIADTMSFMPYGAMIDEFQHEVYNNPSMTKDERKAKFAEIELKYFPSKDYDGDSFLSKGTLWYKQQHVFNNAFYYIDYVLAELCALQVWDMSMTDWKNAFEVYDNFCSIGGELCFTKALKKAGIASPFEFDTIEKVAKSVKEYLDGIDDSAL